MKKIATVAIFLVLLTFFLFCPFSFWFFLCLFYQFLTLFKRQGCWISIFWNLRIYFASFNIWSIAAFTDFNALFGVKSFYQCFCFFFFICCNNFFGSFKCDSIWVIIFERNIYFSNLNIRSKFANRDCHIFTCFCLPENFWQ